jgi:CheY-like chemotaxis protein
MKILVVDDSKAIRLVMDQCVTELGHDVFPAENGAEDLAFVQESNVDLI